MATFFFSFPFTVVVFTEEQNLPCSNRKCIRRDSFQSLKFWRPGRLLEVFRRQGNYDRPGHDGQNVEMKDRPFRPRFARQSNVGHPLKNEQIDNIEPPILSFISLPDLMSMAFCFWRKGCRWRLVTAGPDPRVPYTQTPTKGRLRALKKIGLVFMFV